MWLGLKCSPLRSYPCKMARHIRGLDRHGEARPPSQKRDIDRRIEDLVIIRVFVRDSFNICLTCAFEREQAWREVGKTWWKMLDEWVGVTNSGAQPA